MLTKLNWEALRNAALSVNFPDLVDIIEVTEELKSDEEFLKKIHHALFEIHVIEGFLVCPESGRKFPVKYGIPNMLLHEDEV